MNSFSKALDATEGIGEVILSPDSIISFVEKYYCLPKGSIKAQDRSKAKSEARTLAVALCRKYTRFSYPELSKFFNKDHTTLVDANTRFKKREDLQVIYNGIDGLLSAKRL